VHDPSSSLRIGDIISISAGWRASKHVHHVVNSIIAPFGEPIEARPPIPSAEERLEEKAVKKRAKEERKEARRRELKTKEEGEGMS
jgi:small subunit ribosomal protein S17